MTLVKYTNWAVDAGGNTIASSDYDVRDTSGTLVQIYSDSSGTTKTNPSTADTSGKIEFYVDKGVYDITVGSGISATTTRAPIGGPDVAYFDSRADAVAASDAELDGRSLIFDGTVWYKRSAGATAIPDMQGWLPEGDITPLHFQENTTPGTTDMATGFAAMFAYWETIDVVSTTNGNFRTVFNRSVSHKMRIPAGKYYTTYEWLPDSANGRSVVIEGGGAYQTVIQMPVDGSEGYFLRFPKREPYSNPYHFVDIRGIKFVGGKGVYLNEEDGAPFVQRGVNFIDVDILGFTECAAGSLWGDDPRWNFGRVRIETTAPSTVGLYLPKGVANPHFEDVRIIGCTYRIVTAGDFQSTSIISGVTMFSLPDDDHEADIWLKTIPVTSSDDGRGVIITGNRFSSENRNGKPIILIADGDGTGTDITERHSTSVSSRRFRDWVFEGNSVSGQGTADASQAGPMIVSYAVDIGRARISANSFNVGFSHVLWLAADPEGSSGGEFIVGPNQFVGGGEAPLPCNRAFGIYRYEDGTELLSSSTAVSGDGGIDPSYALVNIGASSSRISMGLATTLDANLVSSGYPDAYGFADSRAVIFTSSDGYVRFTSDPTALSGLGLKDGDNYFIEWEAKQTGATLQIGEVDVEIVAVTAGGTVTRRFSYIPTEGWRRHRVSLQLPQAPTSFQVTFYPSPDNWSASSDRTQIARPYFYRANRPIPHTPEQLEVVTKATLTSASAAVAGRLLFIPDEAGGAVPAFSDGTNWRRVTDRAIVS